MNTYHPESGLNYDYQRLMNVFRLVTYLFVTLCGCFRSYLFSFGSSLLGYYGACTILFPNSCNKTMKEIQGPLDIRGRPGAQEESASPDRQEPATVMSLITQTLCITCKMNNVLNVDRHCVESVKATNHFYGKTYFIFLPHTYSHHLYLN